MISILKKLIIVLCFFPVFSFAQVVITEIMYDLEGADDKKEWIEIHNTGGDTIEIGKWYFYEAGIHHGFVPNTVILNPGERALIVQDVEIIQGMYGSSLKLMRSSFSLHNTGEELGISNPQKEIMFSVTYSSDWGANGNGYSLQWNGNIWIQGPPTPGKENISQGQTPPQTEDAEGEAEETKEQALVEYYTAFIEAPEYILANSPVRIKAFVHHTKERRTTNELRGLHHLSLGDGTFIESGRVVDMEYVYMYPGRYEVVFEYYSSLLAFEAEVPPLAQIRKTFVVQEPNLEIVDIDFLSGITLKNNTSARVNLEGWDLSMNGKEYQFPRNSFLSSGATLTIPMKVHGLNITNNETIVLLRNEHNYTISSFSRKAKQQEAQTSSSITPPSFENNNTQQDIMDTTDYYLSQNPDKIKVDFGNHTYIPEYTPSSSSNSVFPYEFLIGLGAAALILVVIRLRSTAYKEEKKKPLDDEDTVLGNIELLE